MARNSTELALFHQFIGDQLANGGTNLSPEEVLNLWRDAHPTAEDFEESVEALREALEELDAGDPGIPAEQHLRELRDKYGFPHRQ
jgi:hypothetical protein